jgi:hypothetical protein
VTTRVNPRLLALQRLSVAKDYEDELAREEASNVAPVGAGVAAPTYQPLQSPALRNESTATEGGDEEYEAAMEADRNFRILRGLAMAGERIGAAFADRDVDFSSINAIAGETGGVRGLIAKRQAKREADDAARKARMADPNSPESQRFRQALGRALPSVFTTDALEGVTAADEERLMRLGSMRSDEMGREMARKESAERYAAGREERKLERDIEASRFYTQLGESRAARESQQSLQLVLAEMAQRERAARETEEQTRGTTIPGLTVAPGAKPTAKDAEKVKASIAARERMMGAVNELMALYEKHGSEMVGDVATRYDQLKTAIKLEGKSLAELGALSGPDEALMNAISGSDPTSLKENLKGFFSGGTWGSTPGALEGVKKWTESQTAANMRAYGYQPAPKPAAPARVPTPPSTPAPGKPDVDLTSDTVRVVSPDGKVGSIPRANLQKALARGFKEAP